MFVLDCAEKPCRATDAEAFTELKYRPTVRGGYCIYRITIQLAGVIVLDIAYPSL